MTCVICRTLDACYTNRATTLAIPRLVPLHDDVVILSHAPITYTCRLAAVGTRCPCFMDIPAAAAWFFIDKHFPMIGMSRQNILDDGLHPVGVFFQRTFERRHSLSTAPSHVHAVVHRGSADVAHKISTATFWFWLYGSFNDSWDVCECTGVGQNRSFAPTFMHFLFSCPRMHVFHVFSRFFRYFEQRFIDSRSPWDFMNCPCGPMDKALKFQAISFLFLWFWFVFGVAGETRGNCRSSIVSRR